MIIPWPLVFKGWQHSFFVAVGGGSIDLYVSAVTSAPVSNLKFVARPTVAIQLLLCSESTVSELSIFSLVSSAIKQHEL